ncbi:probable UDP-sugar transporter protein SLC35A4 [Chiloscyllium plagiosum]|uniref:probable UDP-sugar transporter protein SLC35A4 n=1 Tax=Chiloscyllium plagiosum TaxID=36176 RepID=UPI001CB88966|nr:probable UDP-sugar transporter protein SLC35A4 [Chiloscyllium plagiosum]
METLEDPGTFGLSPAKGRMRGQVGWGLVLLLSVLAYGSHAPLISLCKVGGRVPFSSSSVVVLVELVKLTVSSVLFLAHDRGSSTSGVAISVWAALPFAVPASLYAVNNNLVVHMQHHMDPVTFQVLSNLKIAATAAFYSLLLRQWLPARKWLALCLLMAAGICHTGAMRGQAGEREPMTDDRMYITLQGAIAIAAYCSISGLSAVYTEWALKSQPLPLNLQNLFLYSFGVLVNLVVHTASSRSTSFFQGYSVWVAVIVGSQALNGLLMSVIMKYNNSMTRLFVISCSMLVNAVLSIFLFNLQLTPLFFVAVGLICLAIHLYYRVR